MNPRKKKPVRPKARAPRNAALHQLEGLIGSSRIAKLLDVNPSTVSRWLSGAQRIERPGALARWLAVSRLVDLMTLDGRPEATPAFENAVEDRVRLLIAAEVQGEMKALRARLAVAEAAPEVLPPLALPGGRGGVIDGHESHSRAIAAPAPLESRPEKPRPHGDRQGSELPSLKFAAKPAVSPEQGLSPDDTEADPGRANAEALADLGLDIPGLESCDAAVSTGPRRRG